MNLPAHDTTSPDPSVASLLKQQTKQSKDSSISAWLSPHAARQIVPGCLAVPAHRQAPVPFQHHCFSVTAWWSTPCCQAPRSTGTSVVVSIAWRLLVDRQAPTRDNLLLVWHSMQLALQPRFTLWYLSHGFSRPASYVIIPPSL